MDSHSTGETSLGNRSGLLDLSRRVGASIMAAADVVWTPLVASYAAGISLTYLGNGETRTTPHLDPSLGHRLGGLPLTVVGILGGNGVRQWGANIAVAWKTGDYRNTSLRSALQWFYERPDYIPHD